MARARLGLVGAGCALLMLGPLIADAQQSVSDLLGRPATAEGQPKSYLEELSLFGYVENSFVWNTGTTGRGDVNELRFYDHDNGYTFNAAELSVKKDPSPRYRLGYGVVVTAGLDSQILGEREILGQVRRAYQAAQAAGTTDHLLNAVFVGALNAGRRVRRETMLGRHPASVSSAAVESIRR